MRRKRLLSYRPGKTWINPSLGLPRLAFPSHAIREVPRSSWPFRPGAAADGLQHGRVFCRQGRALASDRGAGLPRLRRRPGKPLHPHQVGARRPQRLRRRAALRAGGRRRRPRHPAAGGVAALPDDPAGQPLGCDRDRARRAAHLRRAAGRAHDCRLLLLPADEQRAGRHAVRARPRQRARCLGVHPRRRHAHLGEEGMARGSPRSRLPARGARRRLQQFTTVLSPDYDANHQDHMHVDLARRGPDGLGTVCK